MTRRTWVAVGLALMMLLGLTLGGQAWGVQTPTDSRQRPNTGTQPRGLTRDPADASKPPRILADAALLMDGRTGKVLLDKNGRRKMAPASTTKVMTAIVAIEQGNLGDVVEVSRRAASLPGSTMGLRAGTHYTLRELLDGLLLRSGNDAAVAIAEHVAGTVDDFVAKMNEKAIDIGAVSTHFTNPHGLDNPDHYTTVEDMALMTRYAMKLPLFAEIVSSKERSVEPEDKKGEQLLRNTNKLLWLYSWADGVKTGTTGRAGRCLVASATRDGQRLIAVVFRSSDRWQDAIRLLEFGYKNFATVVVAGVGAKMETVRVRGGESDRLVLELGEELAVVLPRQAGEVPAVEMQVEVDRVLKAPLYRGQLVGMVYALSNGRVVGHAPLVAADSVPRWTPWGALRRFFTNL
ncbi:MAG: D-alanyl-D-alanine carboxypeptidase [Firmicutes bacterium]|nr:D-alanyl-D-alanine carboxypeptidase [Bacillota bacterium]